MNCYLIGLVWFNVPLDLQIGIWWRGRTQSIRDSSDWTPSWTTLLLLFSKRLEFITLLNCTKKTIQHIFIAVQEYLLVENTVWIRFASFIVIQLRTFTFPQWMHVLNKNRKLFWRPFINKKNGVRVGIHSWGAKCR